MRLIGFALLAFLLAGVAVFLSNSDALRLGARNVGELALGPRLVFETRAEEREAASREAIVQPVETDAPILLSGLPSYQGATFFMPVDARPVAGYLQVDATVQALAGVEGVLRVSIDNTRRAELQLRPGETSRSLRVELTEEEIAGEKLAVSFSLQGQGANAMCSNDEGIEAVVEIEPTSAVHLTLDEPLKTRRDRALAAGRNLRIGWGEDDRVAALLAGRTVQAAGLDLRYSEYGMPASAATYVVRELATVTPRPFYAWSDLLAADSTQFGLRQFYQEHTWRMRYDMGSARYDTLPGQVDVALELGQLPEGGSWQVLATLNGRLVGQFTTPGGTLRETVVLPEALHRRQNTVEIIARNDDGHHDACDRGAKLFAELLGDTAFRPGTAEYSDPLLALVAELGQGWTLAGVDDALGTADAEVAARLLALLPEPAEKPLSGAQVRVLPRGAKLAALAGNDRAWLVFHDAEGAVTARRLTEYAFPSARSVALLVETGAES